MKMKEGESGGVIGLRSLLHRQTNKATQKEDRF